MSPRLNEQLEQVQKDLAQKLLQVERIGECLVRLGTRLQEEPWNWSIESEGDGFPRARSSVHVSDAAELELLEALDRHRLEWLLEDIRILKRREAELKKLAA